MERTEDQCVAINEAWCKGYGRIIVLKDSDPMRRQSHPLKGGKCSGAQVRLRL